METTKWFWRFLLVLMLIAAMGESFASPQMNRMARAAPKLAVVPPHVVISEFRTRGPAGGNDEFVEIFNATGYSVNLNNWSIRKSSGCATSTDPLVANINTTLIPGQYYLIGNLGTATSPGYTGQMDQSYPASASIANNGGVALIDSSGNIVDQVGMCNDTLYKEPPILDQLTDDVDQSYERESASETNNCTDTDNNAADFSLNASSSNPQTSSSAPQPCLVVTNVTSPTPDGPYSTSSTPPIIDITVIFSNLVDVTGVPTLMLETGVNDRSATYISGTGTNTLIFRYNIMDGDSSGDLDYVATDSLNLSGGSIAGAMGDANLALPVPGTAGSLGANKNIVIDDGIPPTLVSIKRQNPSSASTNASSLVFRVTFSEAVTNLDASDFVINSSATGATISGINPGGTGSYYDLTVSGGNLGTFNGNVGLDLSNTQDITDISKKPLTPATDPTDPNNDQIYTMDHISPTVTVDQTKEQADPASTTPVKFSVVFSEEIDPTTFTASDIKQNGTARFITWAIAADPSDKKQFILSATSVAQNGTLVPSINAGQVKDPAGNNNTASTSTDNNVTYNDDVRPTVTVNQVSTQADPTNQFPILFSVVFSEPISANTFVPADITQNGTATGITWKITDSGDHATFTLSATAVTGVGTLVPSIKANRVTDLLGNTNQASTSTDNSVTYTTTAPTAYHSVIINEIAWSGTKANSDDEWIELYNPTSNAIDLTGWVLKSDDNTPKITFPNGTAIAGKSFFLLARNTDTFKDVTPDLIYGAQGSNQGLLNSGEILRLTNQAGTAIDTANAYTGYGFTKWAAGTASPNYASMERGAFAFSSPTEWVTFAGNPTVHDRSNNLVYGTPGEANWINTTLTSITTIISDLPDPSLVNQLVSVTVTVVGNENPPTGTVALSGANTNCTITLLNGIGSCSIKFTSAGSKTITATYSGDKTHPASTDTEAHVVRTSFTTTPTAVPSPLPPPQLLAINEFVPRPGHDWNNDGVVNTGDEFIEVLNHGVVNVNLSGYSLDDEVNVGSGSYQLPALTLRPGERYVFYGSETGILLGDGGDAVRLQKPNGQLADAYNYSVVERPDQSFCRLPDNGGADDWNTNCYPTPGLQNSQDEGSKTTSSNTTKELYCPIADTLPDAFQQAECEPFGNNIWRSAFWDQTGWYGDQTLPGINTKWPVFAN
jgi:hypothetical protein